MLQSRKGGGGRGIKANHWRKNRNTCEGHSPRYRLTKGLRVNQNIIGILLSRPSPHQQGFGIIIVDFSLEGPAQVLSEERYIGKPRSKERDKTRMLEEFEASRTIATTQPNS